MGKRVKKIDTNMSMNMDLNRFYQNQEQFTKEKPIVLNPDELGSMFKAMLDTEMDKLNKKS